MPLVAHGGRVGAITLNRLDFLVQPSSVAPASTITPAVQVRVRDAKGTVGAPGTTVTIAISTNPGGGTLAGTLTQPTVNGVATFNDLSINNSGTGYTLIASAPGLAGVTSATFTVTASGGATPWLKEDFSTYSSTANWISDPRGIYDLSDDVATSSMALDTTDGPTVDGVTLTQCAKYNYVGNNCTAQTLTRSLNLPSQVTELWLRMFVKHSSDFSIVGSGCGHPDDWKMVFGRLTNLACRFEFNQGAESNGLPLPWFFGGPGCANGVAALALHGGEADLVWDGTWHEYRWHWKIDTVSTNHKYIFNLDGTQIFSKTSAWASDANANGALLYGVSMGRNMDSSKNGGTMNVKWGYVAVFNTDPGWGY